MTEPQFTRKLLAELRRRIPRAEIIKHANPYSAGVPDFSITRGNRTMWVEVKVTTAPTRPDSRGRKEMFSPLQFERLKRLCGYYLIYSPPLRLAWFFPAEIFSSEEAAREGWYECQRFTPAALLDKLKITLDSIL